MERVLIIAGGLQLGGAERVCANISKYSPEDKYEYHYIVFKGYGSDYTSEIEERGGKVFEIDPPSNSYKKYMATLTRYIKKYRYCAIHSHTMFNTGINMIVAKKCGVPCRISHSHTTKTEVRTSIQQKIYEYLMRCVIKYLATDYFACGLEAGYWMYGKRFFDKNGVIIYNGIDTKAFSYSEMNRRKIREKLALKDQFVIGHSGTILPLKNQKFLIDLLPSILNKREDAVLLLMGRGEEEIIQMLTDHAKALHVEEHLIFTGGVMNPYEYLSAMDVFAFPSLREGTPLALLEAQANGLPCVVSEFVPGDAFITDLPKQLPLKKNMWVDAILESKRHDMDIYPHKVDEAGYGAVTSYQKIYDAYAKGVSKLRWKKH